MSLRLAALLAVTFASTGIGECSDKPIATARLVTEKVCVAQQHWPQLVEQMRRYGHSRRLEFEGGLSPHDQPITLNAALIRGKSQISDDDLDLWFVSNPLRPEEPLSFSAISRRPLSRGDASLAKQLLVDLKPMTC